MDFNNWRRIKGLKTFTHSKKIIETAKYLVGSSSCWLFHDHVLVKKGDSCITPKHHDRPYYIFKGRFNVSIWITADKVSREESLVFYQKSHKIKDLLLRS